MLEPERVSLKRLQRYGVFTKETKCFPNAFTALTQVQCKAVRRCRLSAVLTRLTAGYYLKGFHHLDVHCPGA